MAAHGPPVAPAVGVFSRGDGSPWQAVSHGRASRQHPYSSHAERRMSAAPAVSTHNDAQAFSRAKGVSPPPQFAWDLSPTHVA